MSYYLYINDLLSGITVAKNSVILSGGSVKEYLNRSEPQNQPIAVSQPTRQFFCAQSRKGKIIKCIYSILSFKTQQSIAGKLRSSKQ
jgi:hypothetical protein